MALFYIVNRRAPEAETHFKALASEPGGALALADYYTGIGRTQEASETLTGIAQAKGPDASAARLRLAAMRYAAGSKQDAHSDVDALLKDSPRNVEARIAKARMLLVEGKADQAQVHAQEAVNADRGSPAAHYTLGAVALERREVAAAEASFREVVKLNPRAGAAQLQLARLQLARGDAAGALSAAEEAARQRPDDADAAVLVSRSLRAQGELPRAEREISARLAKNPKAAELHLELGHVALQRRQTAAARGAYEQALRLQPALHDARIGLITADISERNLSAAQARVSEWRAQFPEDTRLRVLSARVDIVAGRAPEAERTLRDVVAADASQLEAYDLLGRLYITQGQVDRAIAEFRTLAERSKTPAGALTMIALIHETKGERDVAREQYEKILASEPRSGVAANNLAWIYAETGKPDEAIKLAMVAQAELRGRPEAEDTLGWAYYHKGLTGHAIAAFERALGKAPDNPVYHYHLGLAHAKAGSDANARQSFQRALALKADFAGADDARAKLKALSGT
jgi:tetratricopeptide (TPR) repeat protein